MVISTIKLGFARKKVTALLQKRAPSGRSGVIRKVAVILDFPDVKVIDEFQEFRSFLGVEKEDFRIVLSESGRSGKIDFEGLVIGRSEIGLTGKFRSPEVRDFVNEDFDLLISFTKNESKLLDLIAEASAAFLKVSRREEGTLNYDLSIATDFNEPEVFVEELKKYLKILNRIRE